MSRVAALLALMVLMSPAVLADEQGVIMNLDLRTTLPDGSVGYSINQRGLRLIVGEAFEGERLGRYGFFLTVSDVENGRGMLTIEFYEHASRNPDSIVVAEIVSTVEFELSRPTVFEAQNESFGVDLAFSISAR
jgi:hypothetical protein